ncbi:hypothetical protein [Acidisoma sp. 7E03]
MKTNLFLSATTGLMLLGSTAVFAQGYADPNAVLLKPGQAAAPVATETAAPANQAVGIITLKPGETVATAGNQDLGAIQAGATQQPAGSFQLLEPGQQAS